MRRFVDFVTRSEAFLRQMPGRFLLLLFFLHASSTPHPSCRPEIYGVNNTMMVLMGPVVGWRKQRLRPTTDATDEGLLCLLVKVGLHSLRTWFIPDLWCSLPYGTMQPLLQPLLDEVLCTDRQLLMLPAAFRSVQ